MKGIVRLVAKSVRFYSENDESAFFHWLKSIESIQNLDGELDLLYIDVDINKLNSSDLRELIAVFFRYGIDMHQLSTLKNNRRWKWFTETNTFWHDRVFNVTLTALSESKGSK